MCDGTKAEVYGTWHGGSSYASPELSDIEEFASVDDALTEFEQRRNSGYGYINLYHGDPYHTRTPAVDDGAVMYLWHEPPGPDGFPSMPDHVISVGLYGEALLDPSEEEVAS
jgi:hypothetical protein